jgi:hypothetical protein
MSLRYPSWAGIVKSRKRAGAADEAIVDELYRTHCATMRHYPAEFLKRRIANSVHGLVAYHQRLEDANPRS